jgi:hypothetical protein
MTVKAQRFNRRPSYVDTIQVTRENMSLAADWCSGEVRIPSGGSAHVKIPASEGTAERYTQAFEGDWILKQGKSYKVYTNRAFRKNYIDASLNGDDPIEVEQSVSTPLYDELYKEILGGVQAFADSEHGRSTPNDVADELTQRVVQIVHRGTGKTELIPVPDTSGFFQEELGDLTPRTEAEKAAFRAAQEGQWTEHTSVEA